MKTFFIAHTASRNFETAHADAQAVCEEFNNSININGLSCDEAEVQRRFEELSKEDEYGLYIDSQEVEEDE